MTGSYRFSGYGASARVDAPANIPLEELKTRVAPELSAEECEDGPSDLHLTRWNGEYHLVHGERRYGPYRTLDKAMRGLSTGIHFVVGKRSPMTFLHAGAVEIDGSAVVFPGRGRWWKSAFVASLIEQGCGYLSDEYAVISPHGTVFPLSKPIPLGTGRGDVRHFAGAGASVPGGFVCSAMILTRYEEGAAWEPCLLSPRDAMLETLPSALHAREQPEHVLRAVGAMIDGAICYQGVRSGSEPSADTIRELLEIGNLSEGARA